MGKIAEEINESSKMARAYALEGGEQILRGRLDEAYGVSVSPGATALATLAQLLLGPQYKKSYQAGLNWLRQNRRPQGWSKVPGGEPDTEITQLVQKVLVGSLNRRVTKYFLPGQAKDLANVVLALGQRVVPGMEGPEPGDTALPQILTERVLNKLPPYGRAVVVAAALLAVQDLNHAGVGEAVTYLYDCQMTDGSWSEDIVVTSLAAIALVRAGIVGEDLDKAGRWLVAKQYPSGAWPAFDQLFTWSTGLAVRRFTEFSPTSDERDWLRWAAKWLEAGQNPDGSYGSTPPFTQPDLDDTAIALMALQRLGSSAAAGHSAELLLRLQNKDGGWSTFPSFDGRLPVVTCTFPVYIPSVDVTVHALDALWGMAETRSLVVWQGVRWILEQQLPSGEFPGTWYEGSVYATAQVLEFLTRWAVYWRHWQSAESISAAQRKALQYLVSSQNSDGSWGSSIIETSLAVSALCLVDRQVSPEMLAKGADVIIAGQAANGSFRPSYRAIYAKGWNYEEPLTTALTAMTALERYKLLVSRQDPTGEGAPGR